jgi:hypothetical protein
MITIGQCKVPKTETTFKSLRNKVLPNLHMRWQTGRNSEPYLEREIRKTENMWDQKWQRNRKCLLTLAEWVRVDEIKRKLECNAKKNFFRKKNSFKNLAIVLDLLISGVF